LKLRPNDLEITLNSIFSIIILKNNKNQFIGRSFMSRYPNPLYDQFAAKLNLQLKPPEDDIRRSPNLIYGAISSPIHGI
jgi:UDP-glucose 6-dehydrogenase